MTWVKLDDHIDEHPKLAKVGALGFAFFVASIAYCNRNETDGFVPKGVARTLFDTSRPGQVCSELVNAGLWYAEKDGFRVHGYHDYQPTLRQLEQRRAELAEVRRKAGLKGAESRWGDGKPDGKPIANVWQTDAPVPVPEPVNAKEHTRLATPFEMGLDFTPPLQAIDGEPNPTDAVAVLTSHLQKANEGTEGALRRLGLPEAAYRSAQEAVQTLRAAGKAPRNDAGWVITRLREQTAEGVWASKEGEAA